MSGDWEEKTQVLNLKDVQSDAPKNHAYLIIISGQRVGDMFRVDRDSMVLGRQEDCDVVIVDDGVSRHHAKLERHKDGRIKLIDLGSTNGTYFNGVRITERELHDGDKVQIGALTILKFSFQDSMEERFQKQLFDLATRDQLTRICNRKTFDERFRGEFAYALRHKQKLSMLIMDIDHFKTVNDTYGHQAGDYVLKALAQVVSDMIRSEDVFARYGGEEFALLARDTDEEKGFLFATRVRRAVEKHDFTFNNQKIPITISLGVATMTNANYRDPEAMFQDADRFLYKAKNGGRNRVSSSLTT
jgi:diguanylate cyclase (GGDEF)-like protein